MMLFDGLDRHHRSSLMTCPSGNGIFQAKKNLVKLKS